MLQARSTASVQWNSHSRRAALDPRMLTSVAEHNMGSANLVRLPPILRKVVVRVGAPPPPLPAELVGLELNALKKEQLHTVVKALSIQGYKASMNMNTLKDLCVASGKLDNGKVPAFTAPATVSTPAPAVASVSNVAPVPRQSISAVREELYRQPLV
jgi:hypothetical protein